MQVRFEGRSALVTGGTRGIGAAVVRELVEAGASVIATGRNPPKQGDSGPHACCGVEYEVVDFEDVQETEAFAARMSRRPLDLLVNNAGTNAIAIAGEVAFEDWDRIQRVNLRAPFALCRAIAPRMAERGYGRIVNVSSIFGRITKGMRVAYSASKSGLLGLTRTLAVDYAEGNVLVNAVGPGFIDTDLTRQILSEDQRRDLAQTVPLGRMGLPDEIARVIAFLGSDQNSFITGQHIVADGGFSIV